MVRNEYDYAVALYTAAGVRLGDMALTPDFEPAIECTRFLGMRRGELPPDLPDAVSAIVPAWHATAREPFLEGFRVTITANGSEAAADFPIGYFKAFAQSASSCFVEQGDLKSGEVFRYVVSACPRRRDADTATGPRFAVASSTPPLPLKDGGPLARYIEESVSFEPAATTLSDGRDEDVPFFLPQHLLDEAAALTRDAGTKETGGILIGNLLRDARVPEVLVEVTAQIPARYTHADATKLTFTADTWTALQAAIDLRRRKEIMVGWWHSHPFLKETPENQEGEADRDCTARHALFMSLHDCALHRTVFSSAWSAAVVVSDSPASGLTWALFGWRHGMITQRGGYILGGRSALKDTAVVDNGGQHDAAK